MIVVELPIFISILVFYTSFSDEKIVKKNLKFKNVLKLFTFLVEIGRGGYHNRSLRLILF